MRVEVGTDVLGSEIDPFGAVPLHASRVRGLGGTDAAEDGYLFRTLPIAIPPGQAAFVVRFDEVGGGDTSIFLDLTSTPFDRVDVPVRDRTMIATIEQVRRASGVIEFAFEAHPGLLYALAGYLQGDGDLTATGITIRLLVGDNASPVDGIEPVEIPRLTSLDLPSFADPVSQPFTRRQMRNTVCRDWIERLCFAEEDEDHAWALAYVAQVMTRYGALNGGRQGLCVGNQGRALNALCFGGAADGEGDHGWSLQLGADGVAVDQAVGDLLGRLRGNALAVIVFDLGVTVDRASIERLALDLIADGHDVGQLKFRTGDPAPPPGGTIPFGLIVRHRP